MHTRLTLSALLVVLFISSSLAVAPGSSAARRRPDLIVTSAAASSTVLPQGTKFQVIDTVKNRGSADAGASTNGYFLSTDRTAGGDVKLTGSRKVKALSRRRASTGTARLTVPKSMAPGNYHLIACADSAKRVAESNERNNCLAADPIEIRAATDHDLIAQALASGEIDAETAVVYEVFADFGDPRLPAKFSGDDSQVFESDVLTEVAMNFTSYSPETQALLEPFLIPAFHDGSWWALQNGGSPNPPLRMQTDFQIRCSGGGSSGGLPNLRQWGYEDAAGGKVRIWWQKDNQLNDEPLAENMAAEIDDRIWPQIITGMGYAEPLGDDGSNKSCRGGTDAVDISLIDIPRAHAWTLDKCDGTWGAILFNRNEKPADVPEVLAHEFFHMVQFRYDVKNGCFTTGHEYGWWKEASAQWIEDALYTDDREHPYADRMLDEPWLSLDDPGKWNGEDRFYGEYLLPFFLARTGRKGTVKQIWDNTTSMGMLDALTAAFGPDWDEVWKDFTRYNFNKGEFNYYEQWDGLKKGAALTRDLPIDAVERPFDVRLDSVSAKYMRFTPAAGVTSVKFENLSVGETGMGIQALIEYADGTWDEQDWSDKALVELCLRDPEVVSVTLVFSNSRTDPVSPSLETHIKLTGRKDLCCTGQPRPVASGRADEVLERAVQAGCNVSGSVTYTEHYLTTPSSGCCRDEETTTIKINIQMKPYENSFGFQDSGSTYSITFSHARSGRGSFGIAYCDHSYSASGSLSGSLRSEGGKLVEVGDYNIDGAKAETRELLVGFSPVDFVIPTQYSATYSNCTNTSHNYSESGESDKEFSLLNAPENCEPKDAGYGNVRFVGATPEATTLTTSCSESDADQGVDRTLTGTISLN